MSRIFSLLKRLFAIVNRWSAWSKEHRWVSLLIQGGIIFASIAFVGYYVQRDWHELQKVDLHIRWNMAGVSFVLYGLNYIFFLVAWHKLVRGVDRNVGWIQNIFIYSYSHLTKFLPTPAWFLASRAMLYSQTGMRKRTSLTLTALETLMHFFIGLGFYCVLLVDLASPWTLLYLLGLIPMLLVLVRPQLLELPWANEGEGMKYSRKDIFIIELFLLLTWVMTGLFLNSVISSIIAEQVPVSIYDLWRSWIISNLIAYIGAYLFGGVSVFREFSLMFLLGKWFTPPVALGIAVVSRLVMTVAGIFWALLFIGLMKILGYDLPGKNLSKDQVQ